ncbi:NLR family CARD domain-containing protein 3-like [Engraulis encrasicolus]|uniref:NLR family CARD domain-containing protein 3-like n=1 Tax=Engraulis encrasicolus TaxID=184585 RepID=UPI002FD3B600
MERKRSPSPELSCVSMRDDAPAGQSFHSCPVSAEMQQVHKSHLLNKFQCLMEGLVQQGNQTMLRKIYTDLYMVDGGRGGVIEEHEVRQIERASWREAAQDRHLLENVEGNKHSNEHQQDKDSNDLEGGEDSNNLQQDKESDDIEGGEDSNYKGDNDCDDLEKDKDSDDLDSDGDSWAHATDGDDRDDSEESDDDSNRLLRNEDYNMWEFRNVERPIKCSDLFSALPGKQECIRTVLTKGVAGIGKTVFLQKFILDWVEGMTNQDIDFIFPLAFREINLMKEETISLVDLIKHFFSYMEDPKVFMSSEHRVMFIFDGLDECRLPLDFHSNPECCDVSESVPVDVLLTNLIKGNLLPSALLWITTRPAAADQVPPECVNRVTEISGFNDQQKEEYFRKKLSDEGLASRTIAHLKSSRSLYIMCQIPIFCWISATVVERTSDGSENVDMPRSLTEMYMHFLIIQVRIKHTKYTEHNKSDGEMIFKLGKLAFQQLEKGNLIFYEDDLKECGMDVTEASVYSGVCTQIFREEAGLYHGRLFSFVHLSIQEFLAALYVFLCFINRERNMPDQHQISELSALFRASTLMELHTTAVDLALKNENGHLDLFLRFLLGLSLESNQSFLRHILPQIDSQFQSSEQSVQLVKQKIRDNIRSGRCINLFYCLNELNQHAVVEHTDRSSGKLSVKMLLPGKWEIGEFEFKTSEEYLDKFDLQSYIKTPMMDHTELLSPDDVLQKLMASDVFTSSTSAKLESCTLTEKILSGLAPALTSKSSRLTELTVTTVVGYVQVSGPSLTLSSSAGCHPDCKPWQFSMKGYYLTDDIWSYLVTAGLTSHTSALSGTDPPESFFSTLSNEDCRLEKLQ